MNVQRVGTTLGRASGVWRHVLRNIFIRRPGLGHGISLRNSFGKPRHVTGAIKFVIQDEQALRQSVSSKGASGSVPCLYCRNIYGGSTAAPRTVGNAVHHYCHALPHQFELSTDDDIWGAADLLAEKHPLLTQQQFADLQQATGKTCSNVAALAHGHPVCLCEQSSLVSFLLCERLMARHAHSVTARTQRRMCELVSGRAFE